MSRLNYSFVPFRCGLGLLLAIAIFILASAPASAQMGIGCRWQQTSQTYIGSSTKVVDGFSTSYQSFQNDYASGNGNAGSAQISGQTTVTTTFTWVDYFGHPSPFISGVFNTGPQVSFLVNTQVIWYGDSGTCNDGFGDGPEALTGGGRSKGLHIVQADGSSGTVVITNTLSASATSATGAGVSLSYSVGPDPRGVTISSSIDPTQHREVVNGVPKGVPNVLDSNGTMWADSIPAVPNSGPYDITYMGNPRGLWHQDSSFFWRGSLTGQKLSGVFNTDPSCGVTQHIDPIDIRYWSGFVVLGDPVLGHEHVYIHVNDPQDSADATGNYWLRYHYKFEDFNYTTTTHPAKFVHGGANPDWIWVATVGNTNPVTTVNHYHLTQSKQLTEAATVGTELVGQLTDPLGFLSVKVNANITSTTQFTGTIDNTINITLAPGQSVNIYVAPLYLDLRGTCSVWTASGYAGADQTFIGTKVPTTGGLATISYWTD